MMVSSAVVRWPPSFFFDQVFTTFLLPPDSKSLAIFGNGLPHATFQCRTVLSVWV